MSKTPQRKARKSAAKSKPAPAAPVRKANAKPVVATEWASGVVFAEKEPKLAVSLRLDADVLRFFRGFGSGYQTRINEVLRVFMDAHQPAEGAAKAPRRAKR